MPKNQVKRLKTIFLKTIIASTKKTDFNTIKPGHHGFFNTCWRERAAQQASEIQQHQGGHTGQMGRDAWPVRGHRLR